MKRAKGFTTIELIVIMVIIAILATIAVPGFSRWLPNYRLRAAARDVFSNFQHAKLTAIKRHRTCAITFNRASGTIDGYVVYIDTGNNLEFDSAVDEVLTTVLFSERYKGVIFDTTEGGGDGVDFIDNDNTCPTLAFLSNGFTIDNGGNPVSGSVFLINPNGRQRAVAVSAAGTISVI